MCWLFIILISNKNFSFNLLNETDLSEWVCLCFVDQIVYDVFQSRVSRRWSFASVQRVI
jgi:hypothetical protein